MAPLASGTVAEWVIAVCLLIALIHFWQPAAVFTLRYEFVMDDGKVIHDETVVCNIPTLEKIEKGMTAFGRHGVLRITFDPPLVAEIAPVTTA